MDPLNSILYQCCKDAYAEYKKKPKSWDPLDLFNAACNALDLELDLYGNEIEQNIEYASEFELDVYGDKIERNIKSRLYYAFASFISYVLKLDPKSVPPTLRKYDWVDINPRFETMASVVYFAQYDKDVSSDSDSENTGSDSENHGSYDDDDDDW